MREGKEKNCEGGEEVSKEKRGWGKGVLEDVNERMLVRNWDVGKGGGNNGGKEGKREESK